jgi:mRNA interferase HigB
MRVLAYRYIREFTTGHPDAGVALRAWHTTAENSNWNSVSDVRAAFNTVDYIGNNRFIFNIKGNSYRLVAVIIFPSKMVYIRFIGTHAEYDKIDCKTI